MCVYDLACVCVYAAYVCLSGFLMLLYDFLVFCMYVSYDCVGCSFVVCLFLCVWMIVWC